MSLRCWVAEPSLDERCQHGQAMSSTPFEIHTLTTPEELAGATNVFATALVGVDFPESDPNTDHEPGRTLGAVDDGQVVGTTRAFTSWLTVPGGTRVPHAAVTGVGVLPSHTRRGIVRGLITQQLHDIAARGEPLASLRASEAVIYERYGYGIATHSASYVVTRRRSALRPSVAAGSPVRLVDPDNSDEILKRVYDQITWVGSVQRFDAWWADWHLWSAKTKPRYLVVSGGPGSEDGFASYHPASGDAWFSGNDPRVYVDDLITTTADAYLGLLRFFASLDLSDSFELSSRPIDEPLAGLFADPRAIKLSSMHDETWLRLIDVQAALVARSFRPGPDLTIAVSDALLSANTGTYRITSDGVERSNAAPDLSLDVSALASAYLGGVPWSALALAGRVQEHRPGAVSAADLRFGVARAPFAGTPF